MSGAPGIPSPWPPLADHACGELIASLITDCLNSDNVGDAEMADAILDAADVEILKDAICQLIMLEVIRGKLASQLILHEEPEVTWQRHLLKWQSRRSEQ